MAGVRLPVEPGLLTTPPRASLATLAASWVPLVQSSVGGRASPGTWRTT